MEEEFKESVESIGSELAYIGEKLNEISKCLKKMSSWSDADEAKYDNEDVDDEEEDEDEEFEE